LSRFFDKTDLEKIVYYKQLIKDEVGEKSDNSCNQFVHFDVHTGNLIFKSENVFKTDWEESGFGHPLLDIAVPCAHLMRDDDRIKKLNSLLEGYQEKAVLILNHFQEYLFSLLSHHHKVVS
jgi:thiamine kinase-like enzyme